MSETIESGEARVADLPRDKRDIIERIFAFDHMRAEDVMTPRADIIAVDINTPLPELLRIFHDHGHSRMPVYRGNLDDPVGMVHIKDIIALLAAPEEDHTLGDGPILAKLRRDVLFAPPSMPVTDLLLKMQKSRVHMALVVDEFGGTDGLLTIEDLIEEIIGEIRDEHETDAPPGFERAPDGSYLADARVEIAAFEAATGFDLSLPADHEDDVETLGGLVFALAGRVPLRGEIIPHPAGFDFEIIDADPRRVTALRVRKIAAQQMTVAKKETGGAGRGEGDLECLQQDDPERDESLADNAEKLRRAAQPKSSE